ncbi:MULTISPECIES: ketoacyl-ACP synthase III [unclassified Shewanella]|uniref:ketoacyl-ACP synthase III n=1 Tax=unclassified Shewanella TaxID=196818 RepID=UPI001567AAE4|nr:MULTISPECIES: ketoacyl-ACP synthase III [unclassified Shewanella]MBW3514023.1 ketoacyl-ACP synthase III [Shewanella sp. NKUCC01_JLK]NRD31258.1 ketoacyl-ACP synthase III [Shewanella sp. DC2-4]
MTTVRVKNITISGIVSVLPALEKVNADLLSSVGAQEMARIVSSTGIHARRIVNPGQTALELGAKACKSLISTMLWESDEVGLIIFVTQTPDYPLPGNAVQLQYLLGLDKSTLAFDVNLGCSGFIYGLWQVSQLLASLNRSKAILVVGDTTSQQYSESNRTVAPLFGDAVSAIAIEKSEGCDDMVFSLGSDGSGAPYLIQPFGGAKNPNSQLELFMDGMQVFVFTLREVPKSMHDCLVEKGWQISDVDFCIMHQANEMMLKRLGDKMGFTDKQLVISMGEVGNTSSASIPLALCLSLSKDLTRVNNKLLLSGFGVGWSWGSVALTLDNLTVCHLLDLSIDD